MVTVLSGASVDSVEVCELSVDSVVDGASAVSELYSSLVSARVGIKERRLIDAASTMGAAVSRPAIGKRMAAFFVILLLILCVCVFF